MAENELVNKIMEERIQIGIDIIKRLLINNKMKVESDDVIMDLAVRVGQGLFIEKNKSYRMGQIRAREE